MRRINTCFCALCLLATIMAPAAPITIQAGTFGLDPEWCPGVAEWIEQQATAFTASNPEINVDLIGVAGPSRDRVPIEDLPVLARNVVGIDGVSGYEAAWLAARGDIVPLDKFLPDPEFNKDDFCDGLWVPVTFDGKIWAVPLVAAPLVFLYRTDLFESAGIAGPPASWEAVAECENKLATNPQLPAETFPLHVEDVEQMVLTMLLQQGPIMRDGKFDAIVSHIMQALTLVAPLEAALGRHPSRNPELAHAAMVLGSPGILNKVPRTVRAKCRLIPLPTFGQNVQAPYQVVYLAVRAAKPEYEAASWEFVKWLTRPGAPLPQSPAAMPCRKSFLDSPVAQKLSDYRFQDIGLLWRSLDELVDYGPNNLLNRRQALEQLADAVGDAFGSGSAANLTGYEGRIADINAQLTPVDPPSAGSYALYR